MSVGASGDRDHRPIEPTRLDPTPDPISPETPDDFTVPGTETTIDGSELDLPFEQRTDCAGEFRFFPDQSEIFSLKISPC